MELLEPLKQELEDNFDLAKATENLIREERDMLQGESEERVVLYQLSTSVWDSVINSGQLSNFEESAGDIATAYRDIQELNSVIEKFNKHGDRIMYTPLLRKTIDQYNRKNLLDIIAEMSAEAADVIQDAQDRLDQLIQTECPVCEQRFPSRKAMKSHVTQKSDPEHEAVQDRVR